MKFFAPLFALAAVAVAVPTGGTGPTTGTQQCCQNVTNSSKLDSVTKGLIKALLGVDVSNLNIPIGTGCAPLSILGGVQCNQNAVQCGAVAQLALIGLNCVPIVVNA